MKNITKFLFSSLTVLVLSSFSANALENIAVIDIEEISKEAKVVKYIAQTISKKRDEYQKEITKKEDSLEKEREKIEAKKGILSDSALKEQQEKFIEKVKELKEFAEKRDKTLKTAYAEAIKEVNDKVGEIVSDIAKDKNLELVIPASQTVYSVDSLDITGEVIKKLDSKMSKVKVKF